MLISPAQLAAFAPHCDAATIAPALDAQTAPYAIDTGARISHWMAQMAIESGYFTALSENLNYSAQALTAFWPALFPPSIAAEYARQPQRIANRAYGGRNGNGPEASGDGWRYRGRGFLQHTFKGNYAELARETGLDLVANPDLLLIPANAARCAAEFWATRGCNVPADAGDLEAVTRAVNGGLNGLAERQAALTAALKIWAA